MEIDYKALLSKYIAYVKDTEGTDFIECPGFSEIEFTSEEWKELKNISNN
jgi:hypothetical protein